MTSVNNIVKGSVVPKPEDMTIEDLRYMAKDSLPLWALTSGGIIDGNTIDFDNHRYLLPIYADTSKELVWRKAAQLGATSYMLFRMVHWLLMNPKTNGAIYIPTAEGVNNLSKIRLAPLLNSIKETKGSNDDDKLSLRKVGESNFFLFHIGGTLAKDSQPIDHLMVDEVRLCDPKDVDQVQERISHSKHKIKCFMSTCGLPNDSIDLRYQYGTQHSWHSNCGCPDGCNLALTFPHCIVADDPKRPGEVYYRCPTCKWRIKNPQNGRYIAHNPGADYNSYHVSQLVSAYQTPKEIWTFYNRTTNMAEFYNAKLGLPYIDAENQGVSMSQLEGCVNPDLPWPEKEKTYTAMGIDQGGGYCYVIIADYNEDRTKKRIRHLEVIEQNNPAYMTEGQQVSPFERCAELMEQYKVRICVCDSMPNYNEALRFANKFLGRVFLAYYSHEAKETVLWGDKAKTKATLIKAGPLLKFKYTAQLGRFPSLSMSLSEWADGNVAIPHPDRAVQMMRDEKTNQLTPEAPARRLFRHLACMIRRYNETDPETGRGRWEWIHTGPDHFAHAWNYCNVALERLNRGSYMGFM